jgi:hypothetical protein
MLEQRMNNESGASSNSLPAVSDSLKSTTARIRAIPPVHQSIQANFCKTPGCDNFGIAPRTGLIQTGRGNKASDGYNVVSAGSLDLSCKRCGKFSTIKSNKAIAEELQRQGDLIWQEPRMRCQNDACVSQPTNNATSPHMKPQVNALPFPIARPPLASQRPATRQNTH